jgi:putative membrane protein
MAYQYLKALHIIFVVTWFAGMFYMPRLFIYNTEANEKEENIKNVLHQQFAVMMKRLWFGITWPSALLTLVLGLCLMFKGGWNSILFTQQARWLLVKLCFVLLLYLYHFSLHKIYKQQINNVFKYSSQQLRIWNEVATILLVAIVMLATVKESISFVWGLIGLACFVLLLMSAIRIYKITRQKNKP